MATAVLKHPVKLHKLELTTGEIEDLTHSKLKSILGGTDPDDELKGTVKHVAEVLALRTNKGDGKLDQRQTAAISHHIVAGTIPDEFTSPRTAALTHSGYAAEQRRKYHVEQQKLLSYLIKEWKMDKDLKVSNSILERANGTRLTQVEFCNILDEVTLKYLNERNNKPAESITSGMKSGQSIAQVLDSCTDVVTRRVAVLFTFDDDILDAKSYKNWAKHVELIASFAALTAALKILHL